MDLDPDSLWSYRGSGLQATGGRLSGSEGYPFLSSSLYSPLLAHKKEHICNFAAESFSFLMRKVGVVY